MGLYVQELVHAQDLQEFLQASIQQLNFHQRMLLRDKLSTNLLEIPSRSYPEFKLLAQHLIEQVEVLVQELAVAEQVVD